MPRPAARGAAGRALADASPARFYAVTPCRVADTRKPPGPAGGPALAANTARTLPIVGICGIPLAATAVAVNVTVTDETGSGHLRVFAAGADSPATSTINFTPGRVRANNAVVSLGVGGQITVECRMPGSSGSTHFVLDVTGYFAAGQAYPVITTSDTGTMLVLQTQTPTETVRVGLLKSWGGAITEVSLNGTDYVNNDDPGREIQTSLWDGNERYSGGSWGWDPVEAGDHFYHGSPLLASTLTPDSIYTKTWPIQWAPENFGGGWDDPVPGDAYIEKWISVVPGFNRVFKVHYKITHFGTDAHAEATQELPMMSVNPNVPNFIYYAGDAPWTNGALSRHTMPSVCCDNLHTPERWGAYVDGADVGIALYTPGQYPNGKGFNAGPALGFTPTCPYTWDPGAVLEFDTFILVGPVTESRAAIYALESQQSGQSPLPPLGYAGVTGGEVLSGDAIVEGWAWALAGMASVDVFVDGERVGSATYGLDRPDVSIVFPGAPSNVGFQYLLDTTAFPNGSHTIVSRATDRAGRVATFATKQVTFSN